MIEIFKNVTSFNELIEQLTPDIYQQLKTAVEIGKWPTGQKLSQDQRALCMQAVIAYDKKHMPEQERTGFVPPKTTPCSDGNKPDNEQVITLK